MWSSRCVAHRVRFPLRFGWIMVTFWSWMVWPNRSMRVNLTFRWVTQHIASFPQAGAMGCALPSCVQRFGRAGSPWVGNRGLKLGIFLDGGSPFTDLACLLEWHAWISKWRECAATVVSVHPIRCYAPLQGVLLAGLGVDVGDCPGAVVTQGDALFGFLAGVSGRGECVRFFRTYFGEYANCWIWWFGCCTSAGPDIRVRLGTRGEGGGAGSSIGGICQCRWLVDQWRYGIGFQCSVSGCG